MPKIDGAKARIIDFEMNDIFLPDKKNPKPELRMKLGFHSLSFMICSFIETILFSNNSLYYLRSDLDESDRIGNHKRDSLHGSSAPDVVKYSYFTDFLSGPSAHTVSSPESAMWMDRSARSLLDKLDKTDLTDKKAVDLREKLRIQIRIDDLSKLR